ncbi:cytochrome (ubi)quinol oxidase subunit III [Evansella cellulosilytica]|uniref:Cytochrome-c oxidase n=1 Tax=Evansella cellulosilytica (strain ATCC 21833 / DSM 2522 / FERM P-1141 / JCM 9156 / N-4) TaxID=649639 RepID=E6TUK5_EVAC2|nr:cytochrome (ubi)quinol oxidase subunit III [Evansella cellulosilytica]ADU30895.1 Cytochrome-c oxidase [Evansella cellulosilytica DSM 2522]
MAEKTVDQHTLPPNPEKATLEGRNKFMGFWFFLGGETVLFASLFGTYLGLRGGTMNGPGPSDLFHLDLVFIMTMILLTSSLTSVFAVISMKKGNFKGLLAWMSVTVLLGLAFLGMEIYEFYDYYHKGLGYSTSAFASSFYTLVGTHGAHVAFGIGWITTLIIRYRKSGLTLTNAPKFYTAVLYWHFIDVVWVFIFSVVYLMGIGG